MAKTLAPKQPLPAYVFVDSEPPAALRAAAARGECRVTPGVGVVDRQKIARAFATYIDAVIAREGAARVAAAIATAE